MSNHAIQELAKQLKRPTGKQGLQVGESMYRTNLSMIRHAFSMSQLQDGLNILEIGHGNAKHLDEVLNQTKEVSYTGLEISEVMQSEAKRNNLHRTPLPSFLIYSGDKTPFQDHTFERIITINTLFFWKRPIDFLQELYRILKADGLLTVTFGIKEYLENMPFSQYGFQLYSVEDFQNLVSNTSFTIDDIHTVQESVPSKTNDGMIDRVFATVVMRK